MAFLKKVAGKDEYSLPGHDGIITGAELEEAKHNPQVFVKLVIDKFGLTEDDLRLYADGFTLNPHSALE